ncbi:MAG: TolC family protein [Janthinobacterium lividum]
MRSFRAVSLPPAAGTLLLFFLPTFLAPASAQAPAGVGPATGGAAAAGPGSNAPAASGPAPGVAGGVPRPAPNRPLTLSDVVNSAVGNNSGLVIAQQRLQKAQELIVQVNAQGRPQFSADALDVYSTYNAFAPTLTNPVVTNPTLPGGGEIPSVVDAGTSFSTGFIGEGGGGNAPSTGSSSTIGLGTTTTSGTGAGVGAPATGTNGATTPGTNAPGSLGAQSPVAPSNVAPATAPTAPTAPGAASPGAAPAAPGAAAPGAAVPATTAPAPAAPGAAAPATAAPGTTAPGGAAPGAAAPAAGAGASNNTGGDLPAFLAAYAAAPLSDSVPPPQFSVSKAQVAEAASDDERERPRDTTTGTDGSGTGTTSTSSTSTGSSVEGKRNDAAARVSVAQYLDLFGLLSTARGAQDNVRDFYSLDIERIRNETALAAKNLFFNLLLTQSQVATQTEQVTYAQENVRITQQRLIQGIVSRFDVLTAETALSTARQFLISSEDSRDLAQANLSYLLGTDPDQPLTLETPPLPSLTQTVNLKQSTQTALSHRPEIRQGSSNIQEAQRLVRLAGSTLLPTVSLVASGLQTTTASVTSPRSYATLGAQINLPLDDGGATRSRVRSARIDVQTQALTLEELKLNVALEVRQATLNIRNAQAQVGAAQTGVTQAQEAVRLAYLRYQGGLGTFLDVLNALAQLAATRNNLSSAEFFYQISLAQLVRALGGR